MSAHNQLSHHDSLKTPYEVADPGDGGTIIEVLKQSSVFVPLTIGAGAETRTVPAPVNVGQELNLHVSSGGGGTCTITLTDGGEAPDGSAVATVDLSTTGAFAHFRALRQGSDLKWGKLTA